MRAIEREADRGSLSVRCDRGHIARSNSPRSLVPPSKSERIVESSTILVRCESAESAK